MQTVLHVSSMDLGSEVAVREVHDRFPLDKVLAGGIGVERLVIFIGSGYYALEITVADGNFQDNLERFLTNRTVRELFSSLAPYVNNLPQPNQGTAEMPLATAMLLWQRGEGDATTV